jgi:hypothetical protein
VQSCRRIDTIELKETKSDKEAMDLVVEKVMFETRGEKDFTYKIE